MRINRSVVLLLSVLETDEKKREWRVRKLGTIGFSVFCFWLAERVFPLQRQATSKVSIDIFVRFPLASSAGRSVHTSGPHKTPAATLRRKVVYQLAGWAGKWNAVPLTLNNQALDPFSKDLSLSGGYIY